jgi:hypothetical protein
MPYRIQAWESHHKMLLTFNDGSEINLKILSTIGMLYFVWVLIIGKVNLV